MLEKVDNKENEEDKIEEEQLKKIAKISFLKKLSPYNKPVGNVIIGLIVSCM